MKKILFCILIAFLCSNMYSKDYIIKKDGQNIDCTAITGEDDLNIYFHFYKEGSGEVNTLIKKSDVKEYNFSKRDKFLKKQKMESLKKENEEKKLRKTDSLAAVNARLLETKKIPVQRKNDSLAAINAKKIELNKIQKQRQKDSLATVNAKLIEAKKMQVQRSTDSLATINAKQIELNKIQKQKDSLAAVNAKLLSTSNTQPKSVVLVSTTPQQEPQPIKYNTGDYLIKAGNKFLYSLLFSSLSATSFIIAANTSASSASTSVSSTSSTKTNSSTKTSSYNSNNNSNNNSDSNTVKVLNFSGYLFGVVSMVNFIEIPIYLNKAGHAYKKGYVVR